MTKKDYEAVAQILKDAEPQTDLGLRIVVFKMADMFKSENPRFSHERFYKACGLEDNQYKHIESDVAYIDKNGDAVFYE